MEKFKLKRYNTIEELEIAIWNEDDSLSTIEDLKDCKITGYDQDNKEHTFSFEAHVQSVKDQGYWGFVDDTNTIHYWIGKDVPLRELIHFFAHEIGHNSDTQSVDDHEEEMRAEGYGYAATMAYDIALSVKENRELTEIEFS